VGLWQCRRVSQSGVAADVAVDEAVRAYNNRFYGWDDAVVGPRAFEPPFATELLTHQWFGAVWQRNAPAYLPLRYELPRLVILHGRHRRGGAVASSRCHTISIDSDACRRSWLLHEIGHLLVPDDDGHGPLYALALITLWERELAIPRAHSLKLASEHGVAVATPTRRTP